MNANLVVLTIVIAAGGNEAAKLLSKKAFNVQPIVGGFILGVFLFAMMEVAPSLAQKFCVLIIVASILYNGQALFKVLSATTK